MKKILFMAVVFSTMIISCSKTKTDATSSIDEEILKIEEETEVLENQLKELEEAEVGLDEALNALDF